MVTHFQSAAPAAAPVVAPCHPGSIARLHLPDRFRALPGTATVATANKGGRPFGARCTPLGSRNVKDLALLTSNHSRRDAAAPARRRLQKVLSAWLAAIGLAVASTVAVAQSSAAAPPVKAAFPAVELPERAQGEAAISRLAARLPDVAAWYGMSVPQFARMIRNDRTAWLDRRGRVFFQEDVELPLQSETAPLSADPLSPSLEPLDQTFRLHSRPAAKRTIYLNFVGATLTNTAWNSSSQPTITALPFDLDGVPYSFSNSELERIQYIWKRVAEDYAAFDVNVTTEPPPADRLTRSSSSDDIFGTTVLITKRTFYSCSCGGVAYLSVFDDVGDFYKPALVFYDALGGGNEKYVADAISHEAGHNMSLSHDGTSGSGYYSGHGSGETSWAPIMGVGYSRQLVQWSKGEYADANNTEDDYVRMQNTGLPLRTDDHANSATGATSMPSSTAGGVTTFSGSGVIERPTDTDFFSFTAGSGSVTVNVSPAPRGPKLDIQATLRNSAGTILASSNPTESLPAALTFSVTTAGTYYVSVDGIGKGDPLTTGYTDYGSVGQYVVSVTSQSTVSQPPTAVLSATPTSGTAPLTVNFSAAGSTDGDGSIVSYAWNFGDGGSQTGGTTAQRTYSSAGTYTASLTVTDNTGLTDTKSVSISVTATTTTYALTVGKSGTGSGTVTSSPAGINCGSDCAENYTSGTSVTLTAAAATGSTFAGWSGACSGTGTCTVSMTAARSVTATFNSVSYALSVSKGGLGTGTVTSSPAGISCGSTCSANYASGTSVTLTAAAAAGSTFAGWSGACSGTGTCTVSMTAARSVTATFNTVSYALSVSKSGAGSGTVSSSPAGISCGSTCSANYASGTSVTLTAAAAAGSTFAGWSGACSGTGNCTVSMSAARSVTATFDVARTTSVGNIGMSLRTSWGSTEALASVTVRDGTGAPVSGATVTGAWSGATSSTASVKTNASGVADFRSARIRASTGTRFTFTVTGIALSGHAYDATRNVESSDSITVGGAQPPTAVLSADRTSGAAPLTVNFSAAGSSDADGTIASYAWSFGDGGTAGGLTAQRVYSTPGTYTAALTVTDNSGLTDSKTVTITVGTSGGPATVSVADIGMSLGSYWGRSEATALVTVRDGNGNIVPGATVTGTWSGVVSGSGALVTGTTGQVAFRSARLSASTGAVFTFTVTGITYAGHSYDPTRNFETSDSITR